MAVLSWTPTTSATDLAKTWRIVQLQLAEAFNFVVEEFDILSNKIPRLRINLSARQMILPVDIQEDFGVASIPEAGYEAIPVSPTVVDSEFTWITLHKRFSMSRTAKHLDAGGNRQAMVARQIRFQGMKAVQAIKRRIGDYFYGYSTATVCKVSSVSTNDIVCKDLYGVSGLGTAGEITRMFRVGDYIAVLNPTGPALRANGVVQITAISGATITCGASGITSPTANDLIVFANAVEQADILQTDRARGLTGLLDAVNAGSALQSINPATAGSENWDPGYTDAVAGRFDTIALRKGKQGIKNAGGGDLNFLLMTQGVENDLVAGLRAGLRFSDAFSLEMDGAPKAKGVQLMSTQRVPPGMVFGWDTRNSIKKIQLLEGLDEPGWDEAEKVPNRAAFVFPIDWPLQMVYTNRGNIAHWSNKTEQ
jgi:hypothetical protein